MARRAAMRNWPLGCPGPYRSPARQGLQVKLYSDLPLRPGRALAHSGPTERSCRADLPAHDPCVLANLPDSGEPVLLEELNRRAEQETARSLAVGGHLRDGLHEAAAGLGYLVERAFQR